jgi:hypothetical protein
MTRHVRGTGYALHTGYVRLRMAWRRGLLLVRHLATKIKVFGDVTPCNMLELYRRFVRTRCRLIFLFLLFFLRHYSPLLTLASVTIFLHCWRSLGIVSVAVLALFGFAFFQKPHIILVGGTWNFSISLPAVVYPLSPSVFLFPIVLYFCGFIHFHYSLPNKYSDNLLSTVLTVFMTHRSVWIASVFRLYRTFTRFCGVLFQLIRHRHKKFSRKTFIRSSVWVCPVRVNTSQLFNNISTLLILMLTVCATCLNIKSFIMLSWCFSL